MKWILFITLFLGLTACQSKSDALTILCDAPNHLDVRNASADSRMMVLARHIDDNVSNNDVREYLKAAVNMSGETKRNELKKLLDAEGILKCSMIDGLVEMEKGKQE